MVIWDGYYIAGQDGKYIYMTDLRRLRGSHATASSIGDRRLSTIASPLNLAGWRRRLRRHPDQDFAGFILDGLENGFRIGVNEARQVESAKRNMPSAMAQKKVISEFVMSEVGKGNILGPFSKSTGPRVQINRLGVIPKKHQVGKWRIITDLSFPEGRSVNDAIEPALCSLTYVSVEKVATAAMLKGKGALIAKIDIKSAYRLIPVCMEDRKWLGMEVDGQLYVDGMLPFGLRSAPKLFNAVADALEWCIAMEGVDCIYHYLDDFAVVGGPDSDACAQYLHTLIKTCNDLGVPLAPEKQEGPTTVITFLGIVIDTIKGELRLPKDKLDRLITSVSEWGRRRTCTRKELESLIGVIQHACKVIPAGRAFLRRAISLLSIAGRRHHHIRLNAEFKADMGWWQAFAPHWNGTSILVHQACAEVVVTSDASGFWGCGAWSGTAWFQVEWDDRTRNLGIAVKEMLPIIIAAATWGKLWSGCNVRARCDNAAVVAVVNARYSKEKLLMHMLRCLFFVEAQYQFRLSANHIAGVHNSLADDLSRDRLGSFRDKLRVSDTYPPVINSSLLQWLLTPDQDWLSQSWRELFNTIVSKA